jgi:putative addiction module killer protein
MFEVIESAAFQTWMSELRDRQARTRIAARITRIAQGNLGDWKAIQGAVNELRIDYGPGYRLYSRGAVRR